MHASRTPPVSCPQCGLLLSGATNADGSPVPPEHGDFSVCIDCGNVSRFNRELVLVPCSLAEALALGYVDRPLFDLLTRLSAAAKHRRN